VCCFLCSGLECSHLSPPPPQHSLHHKASHGLVRYAMCLSLAIVCEMCCVCRHCLCLAEMKAGKAQAPTVHIKKFFAVGKKQVAAAAEEKASKAGSRLYVKGVVMGYRRALTNQKSHTSLIKIQGVDDSADLKFYLGKRIMYMYRTKTEKDDTRFRVMWGKVCAPHGTSGVARCKFRNNLPPSAIGAPVRVMLFPSRV